MSTIVDINGPCGAESALLHDPQIKACVRLFQKLPEDQWRTEAVRPLPQLSLLDELQMLYIHN